MDGDVLEFAQVMTVIVLTVASFVGIGLGTWAVWRRLGSKAAPRAMPAFDESRIERIENAVDAIAIEVERISEGQRFTVALLSDRLPARATDRVAEIGQPVVGKRVNTPH
jgi:hypothetical protein